MAGIALACTIPAIAACDRESAAPEQPQASPVAPDQAEGSKESEFNGTLDITKRGSAIPDVEIALPDGTKKKLGDFKGKPLLVNLWATWCGPCVLEMPMLDELAARRKDELTVLVVSQDLDGAEIVEPWFADKGFAALQPWLDPENDLGFDLATGVLPTTVLYDADGKEVWRMIGGHDWSGARTDAMLADTLSAAATSAKAN